MSNSSSQNVVTDSGDDLGDAFAMALEERAAFYEVTVDYYIEEFFL